MKCNLGLVLLFFCLLVNPAIAVLPDTVDVSHGQKSLLELAARKKKIVLIAGKKSHDHGAHEYLKTAQLIKTLFDQLNISGLNVEVYGQGWPPNATALDDANLIVLMTDGQDGDLFPPAPFASKERVEILQRQVNRGCGIAMLHFSLFTSDALGLKMLEWVGGYFDWQGDDGTRQWYSALKVLAAEVSVDYKKSPITNGVKAFQLKDEFYYNIRFKPGDKRLLPAARVPALHSDRPLGDLVAWGTERKDGGRGFCATMGHFFDNWENPDYRKLMLNGLAWAAGIKIPKAGLHSNFYKEEEAGKERQ